MKSIRGFYARLGLSGSIGFTLLILVCVAAIAAGIVSPFDPLEVYNDAARVAPGTTVATGNFHPLGTDDLGRDLLSRILYGSRVSISIGFAVVFVSGIFGILLGMLAGALGGWVDHTIMRVMDLLMSLPSLLLALVVVAVLGPGLENCIVAISLVSLPSVVRTLRAGVIVEKNKNYVWASRHFGTSWLRTYFVGVLPNCMAPLIVQLTYAFGSGILNAAALGFLGLGAQPPTPEWGTMLADGRAFMESASWLVIWPGFSLFLTVLAVNLLGDGLRHWLLSPGSHQ